MAESARVIGKVVALQGEVFIRGEDGTRTLLKLGDQVHEGDVIITGANASVELESSNGAVYNIRQAEVVTLDATIFDADAEAHNAALLARVSENTSINDAIALGGSLDDLLDETEAGLSGGSAGGGHTFVQLSRLLESVTPLTFDFGVADRGVLPEFPEQSGSGLVASNTASGAAPDTTAPSVIVDIIGGSLNVANSVSQVSFTFSEIPVGFTIGDITVTGGVITGLLATANPLVFTATFTATPGYSGNGNVAVITGSYTDAAGNAGTAGSDSVAIDTAPPVPTITLNASITADDVINATEAGQNINISGVVGGDAKVGDTVTLTVNGVNYTGFVLAGNTFSIPVPGSGLVADGDKVIDASVTTTDAAGNSATATDTEGYTVDASIPSVVVDIVDGSLNVADSSSLVTFTFSQVPVGFTQSDITVVGGTLSNIVVDPANPQVYTATFTATAGSTTPGSVSVAAGSYENAAGNAGTAGSDSVAIDTAPPVPTITLNASITADDVINATEAG
ncbi:retention module-containing protein, partial [Herminiimonas aquatilis]